MSKHLNNPSQSKLTLEDAKREYLSEARSCPKCKKPAEQLSWFYFASKGGWITFCHRCDLQVDFFLERREYFSWQEVNICRDDKHLQGEHSREQAKGEYLSKAGSCPKCKKAAKQLSWFYFNNSSSTPKIAGWMTVCDQCMLQVDFFIEEQEYFSWEQIKSLRDNRSLQAQHPPEKAKVKYIQRAEPCPRCNTSSNQLLWFYFIGTDQNWTEFLIIGWLVVCVQCNIQTNFFEETRLKQYSWKQVNACRNDKDLQSQHPLAEAKSNHLKKPITCPMCNTPAEQLSWFYFDDHPVLPGWIIVCDKCNVQVDLLRDKSAAYYSWNIINAARNNINLRSQQSVEDAKERYHQKATQCPQCKTPAEQLSWFYFSSPEQDWRALAGRAGWMTVCDRCNIQVDFFVEILN